jgi:hypothetical protein
MVHLRSNGRPRIIRHLKITPHNHATTEETKNRYYESTRIFGYEGGLTMSATAESSSTNDMNGNTNGVPKSFTPVKQLDINQDPDRVLFA